MNQTTDSLVPLLAKVVHRQDLTVREAQMGFERIMRGEASDVRIAALLGALQAKGIAATEVAGGVRALRSAMIPVASGSADLVDTCGTGGGTVTTFNISTAAALVAAAGGVRVAKHGNRSFTSRSGSADVLEALGVSIDLSPEAMGRVLDDVGIVFMFAPLLHPAMRYVGPVRRELGITTIMNLLGPLTNPAGAARQVIGVAEPHLLGLIADALVHLGHDAALVVHGEPGMDEISPCAVTRVAEVDGGEVRHYEVTPSELGLEGVQPSALAGGSPEDNARIIRGVLDGGESGAARTAVVINAAAAFYVAGRASSLRDGVEAARHAIDSGQAARILDRLIAATREHGRGPRSE